MVTLEWKAETVEDGGGGLCHKPLDHCRVYRGENHLIKVWRNEKEIGCGQSGDGSMILYFSWRDWSYEIRVAVRWLEHKNTLSGK